MRWRSGVLKDLHSFKISIRATRKLRGKSYVEKKKTFFFLFCFFEKFWLGGAAPQTPRVLAGGAKPPQTPPLNGRSSHLIEAAKRGCLDQMIFFSAPLTIRAPPTTVRKLPESPGRGFCWTIISELPLHLHAVHLDLNARSNDTALPRWRGSSITAVVRWRMVERLKWSNI